MNETFTVETRAAQECIDVTATVREIVQRAGVASGLCHVMALHSTAAVVVNETHDPNIGRDVISALSRAVPERHDWLHDRVDDNAHSHIKAAMLGSSELIPVDDGDLLLGTWQAIMLFEFDGPRKRRVSVQILAG